MFQKRMNQLVVAFWAGAGTMALGAEKASEGHWAQWRGPHATGVAPDADPPVEWSETKNVAWKVATPGLGSSTPIVRGDRIFITTAIKTDRTGEPPDMEALTARLPEDRRETARSRRPPDPHVYQYVVLAYDRRDGKPVWRRVCTEQVPHQPGHPDNSHASASPVTDGRHIFAFFGSRGLFALDMDGNVVWEKDLGDMVTRRGFGEGASPALFGDVLVVNWDHEGDSFIVALDKKTGQELWRRSRDEITSWSTPLILDNGGKPQVVVSATKRIRAYDLADGRDLWQCGGMTVNAIPTPVPFNDLVIAMSGFRGTGTRAIRYRQASGDITGSDAIAWVYDQDTPYVPSPLLYEDLLYFTKGNRPILTCLDAKTGEALYGPERLEGVRALYASPVGAAGRVYIVGRNGGAVVLAHGRTFKVLATNQLEDGFDATPAIVGRDIYLRGRDHLYCLRAE